MARTLPRWMHQKHGAYYLVRNNKWTRLSRNLHDALVEYARLTAGPTDGALADLVSRVLADMRETVSEGTYSNYKSSAKRFIEAFVEFTPSQIKPTHIAMFLDDARSTPGAANTLHSFLNGVFKRAVRWGIVESNPVRDIEKFKMSKRDRYITAEEYAAIRQHATPTLQCLMDFAYQTGQRIGECMRIKYADITANGIFFRQKKTNTKVLVAMTPDLEAAISRAKSLHSSVKGLMLFHRRDGSPLKYNTINYQWNKACEAAGIEDANFHDIRAAAATDAKAHGLDSKTLLGHTTESSHNRYLRSREIKVATPNKKRNS